MTWPSRDHITPAMWQGAVTKPRNDKCIHTERKPSHKEARTVKQAHQYCNFRLASLDCCHTKCASAVGVQQPKGGTAWPSFAGSAKALLGPYMLVYVTVGSDAMSKRRTDAMSGE